MSKAAAKKIINKLDGLIELIEQVKSDDEIETKLEEQIGKLEDKLSELENEDSARGRKLQERIDALQERLDKHTTFLANLTEMAEQADADKAEIEAELEIEW